MAYLIQVRNGVTLEISVVMQLEYHIRFNLQRNRYYSYINPIAPLLSHQFCAGLLHDLILPLILPLMSLVLALSADSSM